MPNGGSDCCGTCWFNRTNEGERGYGRGSPDLIPPHCEIRDVAIEDPFYTYCANHPHRRPDRDPIPIGPILRHGGFYSGEEERPDGTTVSVMGEHDRYLWKPSPDSEEIRLHLLDLLSELFTHVAKDRYPIGPSLAATVMVQLGEFREPRAVKHLRWVADNCPDWLADPAKEALARIEGEE